MVIETSALVAILEDEPILSFQPRSESTSIGRASRS
jgi:uncharacterized protein with PIN domain